MKARNPMRLIQRAAQQHAFDDGITEILIGVLVAAAALLILRPGGLIFMLGIAVLLNWALPRLRDRITTPRIGSAVLPQRPIRTIVGIFMSGVLSGCAVMALRMVTGGNSGPLGEYRWLPLFAGLFLSAGFLYLARSTRLKRFYIYLAASTGGGIVFALTMPSGDRLLAYGELTTLLWLLSALFVVTGSIVLVRFIRRNPLFPSETQGSSTDGP